MITRSIVLALLVLTTLLSPADDATTASSATTNTVSSSTSAAGDKILAISNDVGIGSDGTAKDVNGYQARIGELFAPGGEAYILPIRLPQLPDGQQFATVHVRTQLLAINNEANGLANADLYGLGVRDTDKILPTDYYQGAKPDPKATLIQANFLTPTAKVRTDPNTGPFVETSVDGDVALTKYLNDLCAKPGNAGKFLFLRISYASDTIPAGNNAYMLLTSGAGGDNEPPLITYTLGPAKN
jgi:hypothetical protein